jgi:SAM-dependent methyltransferase
VFLNPVFTDAEIENYYRTNHDLQSTIVAQDFGFYRSLYTKGLEMFSPLFSGPHKTILDIGCSAGGFLNIAKEFGWKTFGLEYNQGEAKVARQNGHEVFEMNIKSFLKTSDQKFDAVTLWDVFEHIKNGKELLEDVHKVLTPNGGVFLQSPTPTSLAARILQEKCNMFDGLEHCNLYTLDNVKSLAEKTGFTLEGYDTVISEAGVLANYLDYKNPYLGELNKNSHSDFFSEAEILKNKLGYKFQIFLKKKSL